MSAWETARRQLWEPRTIFLFVWALLLVLSLVFGGREGCWLEVTVRAGPKTATTTPEAPAPPSGPGEAARDQPSG